MKEVLITSGTSFEGYDIVGYGTYKFTQTILNSNFLKDSEHLLRILPRIEEISIRRRSMRSSMKQSIISQIWSVRRSTML